MVIFRRSWNGNVKLRNEKKNSKDKFKNLNDGQSRLKNPAEWNVQWELYKENWVNNDGAWHIGQRTKPIKPDKEPSLN